MGGAGHTVEAESLQASFLTSLSLGVFTWKFGVVTAWKWVSGMNWDEDHVCVVSELSNLCPYFSLGLGKSLSGTETCISSLGLSAPWSF